MGLLIRAPGCLERTDIWKSYCFELAWNPDNEAANLLTGRESAFPIFNEIGRALGLAPPIKPEIHSNFDELDITAKSTCERLINFPDDGSWIWSSNSIVTVTGSEDGVWYLNAKKLGKYERQVKVSQPGTNTLTAKLGNCSETVEFFIEKSARSAN